MTMIIIRITVNAGNAVRVMVIPRACFYIMQFKQNVSKKILQGHNATV